jgi:hypothetical protein
MTTKDELEAAARRRHARAAKYDPAGTWYDKTFLHLPGLCAAARREMEPPAERQADELLWRLITVEVNEHLGVNPESENAVDSAVYVAVVLGIIPFMLEAVEQITPGAYALNAYHTLHNGDRLRPARTVDAGGR